MPTITVSLNGTRENPFERYGVLHNPMPQVADHYKDSMRLNSLGGAPIPPDRPEQYIREVLAGFSPEFVDRCVAEYRPGMYVRFQVSWKD